MKDFEPQYKIEYVIWIVSLVVVLAAVILMRSNG